MMFFYLCAEYAINGWLVTYLQNKPELLAQFAANGGMGIMAYSQTMATLLWLIILVGRLASAALARRLPQKLLMMVSSVGVALFFTLLLRQAVGHGEAIKITHCRVAIGIVLRRHLRAFRQRRTALFLQRRTQLVASFIEQRAILRIIQIVSDVALRHHPRAHHVQRIMHAQHDARVTIASAAGYQRIKALGDHLRHQQRIGIAGIGVTAGE